MFCQSDSVVRHEIYMEFIVDLWVCVDYMGDGIDELDDKLCIYISRSSLSAKEECCRLE